MLLLLIVFAAVLCDYTKVYNQFLWDMSKEKGKFSSDGSNEVNDAIKVFTQNPEKENKGGLSLTDCIAKFLFIFQHTFNNKFILSQFLSSLAVSDENISLNLEEIRKSVTETAVDIPFEKLKHVATRHIYPFILANKQAILEFLSIDINQLYDTAVSRIQQSIIYYLSDTRARAEYLPKIKKAAQILKTKLESSQNQITP
jgi:hypothetical protein